MTAIGKILRERRLSLHKSQEDVARLINVPRSTVQRVEAGKLNPTWSLVVAIAEALELQPVMVPRDKLRAVEVLTRSDRRHLRTRQRLLF